MSVSALLILCAIVCFVLAVFNVGVGVSLIPLGLVFFAAGHLPLG
jgi:hypothetical protein